MKSRSPEQTSELCPHGNIPASCEACKESAKIAGKLAAIEALGVSFETKELAGEDFNAIFERAMFEGVHGLPEELAERLSTVDVSALNERAQKLIAEIVEQKGTAEKAKKQIELMYQFITLISRVQGAGDKAITPALARELNEMDCSLSAWSLKEKLQNASIDDYKFEFGYPKNHAVGIITVADGRKLYVDAQNGYIAEIELAEVEHAQQGKTAYPIFEVTQAKSLSGHLPDGSEVVVAQPGGLAQVPRYLGIRKDGTLHTIGNMHMFTNPKSPIYSTHTAQEFRKKVPDAEHGPFGELANEVAGGLVIQETEFDENNDMLIVEHG
jgi:hypothetical protein